MVEIQPEEYKLIALEILDNFVSYCESHNLRYYLAGGTLIGALRHKGFIPWDDDIDIIMPRPDYMYLMKHFNVDNQVYKVRSIFTEQAYSTTFATIEDTRTIKKYNVFSLDYETGMDIDIFPIDGAPESYVLRRQFWRIQNLLARLSILSTMKFKKSKHYSNLDSSFGKIKSNIRTVIKFMGIPFARLLKPLCLNKVVNLFAMRFDVDSKKFIGVSVFPHYGYKECVHGKEYLEQIEVEFEGRMLKAPKGYNEYLTNIYGDYMKMPSKDKQVSHHDFTVYRK